MIYSQKATVQRLGKSWFELCFVSSIDFQCFCGLLRNKKAKIDFFLLFLLERTFKRNKILRKINK